MCICIFRICRMRRRQRFFKAAGARGLACAPPRTAALPVHVFAACVLSAPGVLRGLGRGLRNQVLRNKKLRNQIPERKHAGVFSRHRLSQPQVWRTCIRAKKRRRSTNYLCTHKLSSFIQTILSAPESNRICLAARGLYHRWGLSPRPEDYSIYETNYMHFEKNCQWQNSCFLSSLIPVSLSAFADNRIHSFNFTYSGSRQTTGLQGLKMLCRKNRLPETTAGFVAVHLFFLHFLLNSTILVAFSFGFL